MGDDQERIARGSRQLPLQTVDLVAAFMVWVILSTLLPFIKSEIALSQEMAAWVVALPVVLGSALRIPFGYLAGRYGSRIVYVASFFVLIFPLFFLSEAATPEDLIFNGIMLGVAGAVFSVGVTSLPRYFPKERQGFVNGVYGLGNIGTAVTAFGAPAAALYLGWHVVVKAYIGLAILLIIVNLLLGDKHEEKLVTPIGTQFKAIGKDGRLWSYSWFYFITFGSFVAFTMIMPNFLSTTFLLDGVAAGLSTGVFIVLAACVRVVGGWLADRFNPNRLLIIVFACMAVGALLLSTAPPLPLYLCALYFISIFCGLGNGIVFKLVPTAFPKQAGVANGIVAMMGGFGGFFPPLVLSFFLSTTGSYLFGFLLYALSILSCLLIVLFQMKR